MHITKIRKIDLKYEGHCIQVTGYGDCVSRKGKGIIAVLTTNDANQLKLYVWADINQEEPTHSINLENAKETKRKIK